MSIVTNYESVPNRIRTLIRIVAQFGPISREDVVSHFMPSDPKFDQVSNIVRDTKLLGLITEKDGKLDLGKEVLRENVDSNAWFLNFVERNLFSKPLGEPNNNHSVAYAIAWLLTQSVAPEIKWGDELAIRMKEDMDSDDVFDITNSGRAAMLCYWMRFLGYGEAISLKQQNYIISDPTRAINRWLEKILSNRELHPIGSFVEIMGRKIPVLETGFFRSSVERLIRRTRDERKLSESTSLALRRLELRGVIRMSNKSDAETYRLDFGRNHIQRVSHIEYTGE